MQLADWRSSLRTWRRRRGWSQRELAGRAGLSEQTVRSYEIGTRNASEHALRSIVNSLGVPREEANAIYAAAGYSIDLNSLFQGRYIADAAVLQEQLDQVRWPAFITDQAMNLVAANPVFEAIWGVDLSRDLVEPGARNFLARSSDPTFTRHISNFDDLVSFMLGLAKGDPRVQQDLEHPAPWLQEAVSIFLAGEASLVNRVVRLWDSVQPIPHRTRHHYKVILRYERKQRIEFAGLVTIADIWNELSWNDWVPASPESWQLLDAITQSALPAQRPRLQPRAG